MLWHSVLLFFRIFLLPIEPPTLICLQNLRGLCSFRADMQINFALQWNEKEEYVLVFDVNYYFMCFFLSFVEIYSQQGLKPLAEQR